MVGFIKIGILFLLAGIFGEEKLVYKGELNEASTEVQNRDGWDNFTDHYVVGKNPTTPNVYEVKNYTLGVKNELSKSGEIDFSGLSELEVIEGENVQIVADSFTGYVFSHWEIDGVNVGGGHEYEFKMPSKDINVVGKFVKQAEPTVKFVSPQNNLTISESIIDINLEILSPDSEILFFEFLVNNQVVKVFESNDLNFIWDFETSGSFVLNAIVYDNVGNKVNSSPITVNIQNENILPEVSITSPANGTEYAIGESVTITADATDADGAITKVDFYVNGSLIGSDNTAPYTLNWNATDAGSFELTAVATDDRNGKTTSASVTVTVIADNTLPEVSITSPANGSEYAIGEAVTITADATDADGAITKVDFYVNGGLIGSDNTAPYTINWNAAEAGNFELTAVATDDRNGKTTSASVTVTVIADNTLPEVSITSPANGSEYAIGEAVTITADATDADGAITKVDFYINGSLIGSDNTAPYTINWNATEAGNFELTAVATDDRGGETTSAAVTVTVIADNILPEVSITSPANGTEYAIGESVTITADATDADGAITKVDFYVNGGLIGSDNTAPFTANWNAAEAGNFELTAVATDDRNGKTTSAAVTVTVIADNILPEVSITSPSNGIEYAIGEAVTITADATDADGAITKVDFYVNGSLIGSDNTAPFTANWNATEAGSFELTAVATDDRNGKTTSAAVTVTVIADNILPEVSVTSPANGTEYAIGEAVTITADATDADGTITKVDFYVNGSLIGSDNTAPYTANWNATEAGSFELTAVATDDRGGENTSAAVTVTVIADNILPEVSITSPANGSEYAIGKSVTITADATDADGAITKVDFYVNGSLIGSDNTAPYTINWNATEAGNFELTAVATDDRGGETTSAAVTITVIADNILPEVSITSPTNGIEYAIGKAVNITANATDADGAITKVDFYVNGSLIGTSSDAPFTANWNAAEAGNFELTAVATDDRNGKTTSAAVTVTVIADNILPEVSITSPSNGTEYAIGEAVNITANATDADGAITKVDFYVNGSLIGSDNTAPFTANWNAAEAGNFELTAVATDDRGGETTSVAVPVTVIADNVLPEVSITSPAEGSEYAIGEAVTITADATDADGTITKVDFYVNGSLIGSDNTAPYTANWNATEAGSFELTAVATDDRGGENTSAAVTVTVIADNILPEVSITSPANGSEYAIGKSVTITADATDADGAITKVDFYVNGSLIGSDNTAPYTINWNATEAGNFELTAVATDDRGGETTSAAVTVTVIADNILPEVSITSPANGIEYAIGEAV
ncbi:Ig-like domain-containing protein, partial [Mongoliibacter ruber]